MDLQEIRSLFPGLDRTVYMNTAALAIGSTPACEAYKHAISQWSEGKFDWMEAENAGEEARALFASIINADVEEIAIIPAVSTAAGIVSGGRW